MQGHLISACAAVALGAVLSGCGEKLPADEAAFIRVNADAAQRWDDAPNNIQREPMRAARDSSLCAMPSDVTAWSGTVQRVGTYITNEISFEVRIGSDITLRTEGEIMDDGSKIIRGTPLAQTVVTLREGQRVKFSGHFLRDEKGCLQEASFTDSGSLHNPEFLFAFTGVMPEE
jgi:hypothetical protein